MRHHRETKLCSRKEPNLKKILQPGDDHGKTILCTVVHKETVEREILRVT